MYYLLSDHNGPIITNNGTGNYYACIGKDGVYYMNGPAGYSYKDAEEKGKARVLELNNVPVLGK